MSELFNLRVSWRGKLSSDAKTNIAATMSQLAKNPEAWNLFVYDKLRDEKSTLSQMILWGTSPYLSRTAEPNYQPDISKMLAKIADQNGFVQTTMDDGDTKFSIAWGFPKNLAKDFMHTFKNALSADEHMAMWCTHNLVGSIARTLTAIHAPDFDGGCIECAVGG